MQFTLPQTQAEILTFAAGAATLLAGLFALFAPGTALRLVRFQDAPVTPAGRAEMRSTVGGFYIGTGLMAVLLFDQPFVQLMLGGAFALAAFGRVVGLLSDTGGTVRGVFLRLVQFALAAMPLAAAFGLVN